MQKRCRTSSSDCRSFALLILLCWACHVVTSTREKLKDEIGKRRHKQSNIKPSPSFASIDPTYLQGCWEAPLMPRFLARHVALGCSAQKKQLYEAFVSVHAARRICP